VPRSQGPTLARRRPPVLHGLAVVDKPAGMTSHDVVAALRRRLGERRMGHSGTLDPDATGVLLVGVGSVTRLLRFLTELPKTYTGEVVLGVETTTLDAAGEVTARHDMSDVTDDAVRQAVADHLTGPILQVPPMVSAVRVGGRRLHELAREGIEVERAPRPVVVHRFGVDSTGDAAVYRIQVECSSGTYVRVLAADLGRLLGGGAHLRALRRTAIGSFGEVEARPLEEVFLLSPAEALRDYASVTVDAEVAAMVAHGRVLPVFTGRGPWAVLDDAGDLLAVYEAHAGRARPAVVLSQP
jgi:tRNA pseudouridine55 synthase